MEQKRVTIIIPTVGKHKKLLRAVDSVIANNAKAIIVNDGGPSFEIHKTSQLIDLVELKVNKGPSAARNYGVFQANTEFVGFLDSDDYFLEGKIEEQVKILEKHQSAVCLSNYFLKISETELFEHTFSECLNIENFYNEKFGFPNTSAHLWRKSDFVSVGGFDEELKQSEDLELLLRAAVEHKKEIRVSQSLGYVFDGSSGESLSRSFNYERLINNRKAIRKFRSYNRNRSMAAYLFFRMARADLRYLRYYNFSELCLTIFWTAKRLTDRVNAFVNR